MISKDYLDYLHSQWIDLDPGARQPGKVTIPVWFWSAIFWLHGFVVGAAVVALLLGR